MLHMFYAWSLLRNAQCHAHTELCTASEKQHSFEVKKTTQIFLEWNLVKKTKPMSVKKREKKRGIGLNKVFLPCPFLPGVAEPLCLFILYNISVGHPSLHPSKNTQSRSQVQVLDQHWHCVLQVLSAAPGTARDGKYTQANSISVDTHCQCAQTLGTKLQRLGCSSDEQLKLSAGLHTLRNI